MRTFFTETVLDENGMLKLDHLPFASGEKVRVYLESHQTGILDRNSLRGTVSKYEQPFEPVAQDDWAAVQ